MIYDRMGRWYDVVTAFGESRLREAGLAMLRARPGEVALELGPGTGHGLASLSRSVGPAGLTVGVDLSAVMLGVARERLAKELNGERIVLARGNAAELPVRSSSVDLVFASFALELFDEPNLSLVLGECRRVLRADGRLGVVSLDASGKPTTLRRLYEWTHRRWPAVVDCRPIRVLDSLRSAGFDVVESAVESNWGLPVAIVLARPRPSLSSPAG